MLRTDDRSGTDDSASPRSHEPPLTPGFGAAPATVPVPSKVVVNLDLFIAEFKELVRERADVYLLFEVIYHAARLAGPALAPDAALPSFAPQEEQLSRTMVLGYFEYYLLHYLGLPFAVVTPFLEAASVLFADGSENADERLCFARECGLDCPGHLHVTAPLSLDYHQEMAASLYSVLISEVCSSPVTDLQGALLSPHEEDDPKTEPLDVLQLAFAVRLHRSSDAAIVAASTERKGDLALEDGVLPVSSQLPLPPPPATAATATTSATITGAPVEVVTPRLVVFATADPSVSAGVLPLLYMLRNDLNEPLPEGEEEFQLPEIELLPPCRFLVADFSSTVLSAIDAALPAVSPAVLVSELERFPPAALASRKGLFKYIEREVGVEAVGREVEERQLRDLEEEYALLGNLEEEAEESASLPLQMALRVVDSDYNRLTELHGLLKAGADPEPSTADEEKKKARPAPFRGGTREEGRLWSLIIALLTAPSSAAATATATPSIEFTALPGFLSCPSGNPVHRSLARLLARRYLYRQREFLREALCFTHGMSREEWDIRFCFFQRHSRGRAKAVFLPPDGC